MNIDGKEYVKTGTKPVVGDLVYITKMNTKGGSRYVDEIVKIISISNGAYKIHKYIYGERYINDKFDEFHVLKEVQPTHKKIIKTKIGNFENEEHKVYYPNDEEKCKSILDEYEKQLELIKQEDSKTFKIPQHLKNSNHFSNLIEDEVDEFKKFLLDKNDRYGDSVLMTYQKYGQVSFDVRIEDKKNRLKYLLDTNRDIEDTIKDIHGYMMLNKACEVMDNEG